MNRYGSRTKLLDIYVENIGASSYRTVDISLSMVVLSYTEKGIPSMIGHLLNTIAQQCNLD
jgi:hypothetical protein